MFDLFLSKKDLKKNEAGSLYEATEVKMEARFQIYLKFYIKYWFAVVRAGVLTNFETT